MFHMNKTSLFRLYAEPHWVDIDLWLYLVTSSKTEQIANGTVVLGEVTMKVLSLCGYRGSCDWQGRVLIFDT